MGDAPSRCSTYAGLQNTSPRCRGVRTGLGNSSWIPAASVCKANDCQRDPKARALQGRDEHTKVEGVFRRSSGQRMCLERKGDCTNKKHQNNIPGHCTKRFFPLPVSSDTPCLQDRQPCAADTLCQVMPCCPQAKTRTMETWKPSSPLLEKGLQPTPEPLSLELSLLWLPSPHPLNPQAVVLLNPGKRI